MICLKVYTTFLINNYNQCLASAKDLGMELDECLSYDEHITKLVSKCIKSLCQINQIKHILDDCTRITV